MPTQANRPTVFLSSRMDETATSRRAVFDAAIESGLVPITFETMPSIRLDSSRVDDIGYSSEPERRELRLIRRAERLKIDEFLWNSDYFVGIYADTFGAPEPFLCGLRPIEYEFLRFLIQWRLKLDGPSDEFVSGRLKELFPLADEDNPFQVRSISDARIHEERIIRRELSEFNRACAARHWREALLLDGSEAKSFGPYARVFADRVRLFHKKRSGDGPVSHDLVRALRHKPVFDYMAFRSHVKNALPAYFPATASLHNMSLDWLSTKRAVSGAASDRRYFKILDTGDDPGYIRVLCQESYRAGFNIDYIQLGLLKGGSRVVLVCVDAYHGLTDPTSLSTRIGNLQRNLTESYSQLVSAIHQNGKPVTVATTSETEFGHLTSGKSVKAHVAHGDFTFVIRVVCADVPGMMYKAVERIAFHSGSILGITTGRLRGPSGVEWLDYDRAEMTFRVRFAGATPDTIRDRVMHKLCAELRLLIGVHDAQMGRLTAPNQS